MKQFLEENGVSFHEIDVASDQAARDEMVKKSGRLAVPVIEIGNDIIIGFDEPAVREKLGL